MMTLHLLNKSPQIMSLYSNMLASLSDNDSILLIEDGVYGSLEAHTKIFKGLPGTVRLFVLKADTETRGLSERISALFEVIDDNQFVELTCQNEKVVSWY